LKSKFISGIPKEEQEELEELFRLARPVRERLSTLMEKKAKAANSNMKDQYESASWAYKQADLNGYLRAIKDLLTYLED